MSARSKETPYQRLAWWFYSITPREYNAFMLGGLVVLLILITPYLWECVKTWRLL